MSDRFMPMAEYLRASVRLEAAAPVAPEPAVDACPDADAADAESFAAIADVRRFRAALADALDVAVAAVLEDLAASVLARELRIEPADVRAIVENALERCGDVPLRIRANPLEAASLDSLGMVVVADGAMRAGDVVIELRSGTIDATLGARLARVLAEIS